VPVVAEPRREDRVTAPDGLHPIGAPSAHGWWQEPPELAAGRRHDDWDTAHRPADPAVRSRS